MSDSLLSRHPIDVLIREIVKGNLDATSSDVEQIIERLATAPFMSDLVPVPRSVRELIADEMKVGAVVSSLTLHLLKRLAEEQWSVGANEGTYLADLRFAIRNRSSRLAVYNRRGGVIALSVSQTIDVLPSYSRGDRWLPLFVVVYSVDRGMIVSGYQATSIATITIPRDARWLR